MQRFSNIQKVSIIGAGKLATVLANQMQRRGAEVVQVYNRTADHAKLLAEQIGCDWTTNTSDLLENADLYLIAVSDTAITSVLNSLSIPENALIVHTAGSVSINILKDFSKRIGVFYPLQSFLKDQEINFRELPCFIESNNKSDLKMLGEFARSLEMKSIEMNSEQRKTMHLSAIFANNFVNHLYTISTDLLKKEGIDPTYIQPLIFETALRLKTISPTDAQTGPAMRHDNSILDEHLKMLDKNSTFRDIYALLTESIFNYHNKRAED